ncbi:AAA family ATPase [Candidatus Uhrbacteria bacterium CG_4_9_14_3_um_filter_36_7]|uniref:Replication-associated recombination protein A n=1 Tax=Candidatus Uhrbacteria bacterium CG_4_9_14_3_um_filter_36_7 TaxID=1975033 RepID=A0A2M7XIG6_9BACT|nr:MAG: AAA family ATPase [Candidatus Uhrbacteria bacterium CG_4_9_14_3_um_filter_36_7]
MDLFDLKQQKNKEKYAPLSDRLRPKTLETFLGQSHLVGRGQILQQAIEKDELPSMIFWGPPGTGKTTLARIIANLTKSAFIQFSAVHGNVKDIRIILGQAKDRQTFEEKRTILFVDEIHRFNKLQQDAFLPSVEDGTIVLIGATTENPSFEINSALLSRCRVFTFEPLTNQQIQILLQQALTDPKSGFEKLPIEIEEGTLEFLSIVANGDARTALNALELAITISTKKQGKIILEKKTIEKSLQRSSLLYDQQAEQHYNIISALHKSMRGSDPNAALYWLGRMLEAGEDPLFIARRLIRFASEDIGLADPQALVQATTAYQAAHAIGMPEANVVLAQAVVYLSLSPKNNKLYEAYNQVQADIKNLPLENVPLHLRNAPTELMKEQGYGKDYKYNPNVSEEEAKKQTYLPESLQKRKYWE